MCLLIAYNHVPYKDHLKSLISEKVSEIGLGNQKTS